MSLADSSPLSHFCSSSRSAPFKLRRMHAVTEARLTGGRLGFKNASRGSSPIGAKGAGTSPKQRLRPRKKTLVRFCGKRKSCARSTATCQSNCGTAILSASNTASMKDGALPFCVFSRMPCTFSKTTAWRLPMVAMCTQYFNTLTKTSARASSAPPLLPLPAHGGHGGPETSRSQGKPLLHKCCVRSPSTCPRCSSQLAPKWLRE